VVVDDTQLSLAIGKKGQNVRLAAKLLGWRIDIKSEEEKRQEVESQMAAVVPGAPVSVLIDHGLTDIMVGQLMEGGVTTVEHLGAMTPEELEALPGIDPETVERIQVAVNSYYRQFEEGASEPAAAESSAAEEPAAEEAAGAPASPDSPVGVASAAASENESVTIENAESSE
jgi:N utilization substance protein A